jgi:hypothetical protein
MENDLENNTADSNTSDSNTTLDSLEQFIDSKFSMTQTSTPIHMSEALEESDTTLPGQDVMEVLEEGNPQVSDITKTTVFPSSQASSHASSQAQASSQVSSTPSTPSALISLLRRTLSSADGQENNIGGQAKKRKYVKSPIKSQNLSKDQVDIAEGVFESLVDIMSGYLKEFKDDFAAEMQVSLQRHNDGVELAMSVQEKELVTLTKSLKSAQQHNVILEGRLTRAEKQIEDMREELLQHEARSMRDNLIFYNIPESTAETEDTEHIVRQFLQHEMKVSNHDMGSIKFDRVHRAGARSETKHRVIVAKFNPSRGKDIVLKHAKNIAKGKGYGVNEQLPRELEERKKQLLPKYKEARANKQNPKWSLDKLIVGKNTTQVHREYVRDINTITNDIATATKVKKGPPLTAEKSTFQGHCTSITSQDDIVPALHAIYADSRVARANHNIYAYRLQSGNRVIEHYEDDGEYGAGRKLLTMMKDEEITGKLICVSRWYGKSIVGRAEEDQVTNAAKEALEL